MMQSNRYNLCTKWQIALTTSTATLNIAIWMEKKVDVDVYYDTRFDLNFIIIQNCIFEFIFSILLDSIERREFFYTLQLLNIRNQQILKSLTEFWIAAPILHAAVSIETV